MSGKFILVLMLFIALYGCASVEESFYYGRPGNIPFAGGEMQLITSSPDYAANDPLVMQDRHFKGLFGTRNTTGVSGGVGLMQVWEF
ncbi:MAG: hypothetical protein LLG06_14900 [Desulfobacteraceae bacterium]|nr:hypothetical protein [Desulfobacteraceae bacterium]